MGRYYIYDAKAGPEQVSLDVTSACNLRCVHCYNNSGSQAPVMDMTKEEKLSLAEQVAEMNPVNVCLCGGEVTCVPYLLELVDILRPKAAKLSMVTNGFLIGEDFAKKIYEHGIDMVQVSLDGAEAWQHDSFRGVAGSFQRAKRALGVLQSAGIKECSTSFIPNRLNCHSLPDYLKLLLELGIRETHMMPLLPSGRGRSVGHRFMLNDEESFFFCRELAVLRKKYMGRLLIKWGDPLEHLIQRPLAAAKGINTAMMDIKTNGDLQLSPYLPLIAGNTARHTLAEYWQEGYRTLWGNRRYTAYFDKIHNIYDLEKFDLLPFEGKTLLLDLLDGR